MLFSLNDLFAHLVVILPLALGALAVVFLWWRLLTRQDRDASGE